VLGDCVEECRQTVNSFLVAAADALAKADVRAAVVSMPSFELFREQSKAYQVQVLGNVPRIAVEAGVIQCWYEWLGAEGRFVGLSGFGASAPGPTVFEHFGLTAEKVAEVAQSLVKGGV
jgi:transketolase